MNFQIERYTCRKLMTITQEEVEECFHFLKRKETKNIGSCCSSFLFVASCFPIRVDSLTNKSRGKKKKEMKVCVIQTPWWPTDFGRVQCLVWAFPFLFPPLHVRSRTDTHKNGKQSWRVVVAVSSRISLKSFFWKKKRIICFHEQKNHMHWRRGGGGVGEKSRMSIKGSRKKKNSAVVLRNCRWRCVFRDDSALFWCASTSTLELSTQYVSWLVAQGSFLFLRKPS